MIQQIVLLFFVSLCVFQSDRIFAAFSSAKTLQEDRTTIDFPSEIYVSQKTRYSLYDLTDVRSASAEKLEELKQISFDFLPFAVDPGVQRGPAKHNLNQKEVVHLLRSHPAFQSNKYNLKIPQEIVIQVFPEKILAIEVERKIKNHLSTLCSDCKFKISLSKMPTVKSSEWQIDFSNLKDRGAFLLSIAGEATWVSGFIKTEKPVVVAQRDIRLGEEIRVKDFSVENIDITYAKDYFTSVDQIENAQATSHISAFSPLSSRQMKKKPDVIRGQQVQIMIGDEQLQVSASAVSEQEGVVGDVIRLKLQGSQKLVTGEVVQKGVVKIQ